MSHNPVMIASWIYRQRHLELSSCFLRHEAFLCCFSDTFVHCLRFQRYFRSMVLLLCPILDTFTDFVLFLLVFRCFWGSGGFVMFLILRRARMPGIRFWKRTTCDCLTHPTHRCPVVLQCDVYVGLDVELWYRSGDRDFNLHRFNIIRKHEEDVLFYDARPMVEQDTVWKANASCFLF